MRLSANDLRHLADAIDRFGEMRSKGIQPGPGYKFPTIAHGDTNLTLKWVESVGAVPNHYVITEAS